MVGICASQSCLRRRDEEIDEPRFRSRPAKPRLLKAMHWSGIVTHMDAQVIAESRIRAPRRCDRRHLIARKPDRLTRVLALDMAVVRQLAEIETQDPDAVDGNGVERLRLGDVALAALAVHGPSIRLEAVEAAGDLAKPGGSDVRVERIPETVVATGPDVVAKRLELDLAL